MLKISPAVDVSTRSHERSLEGLLAKADFAFSLLIVEQLHKSRRRETQRARIRAVRTLAAERVAARDRRVTIGRRVGTASATDAREAECLRALEFTAIANCITKTRD